MKSTILHVSMTLALLAMPVAALAADTPASDHMAGASSQMATMACRPATAKDTAASADAMAKAHVMMATMGTEKLVCMKLNHDAMMAEAAKGEEDGHRGRGQRGVGAIPPGSDDGARRDRRRLDARCAAAHKSVRRRSASACLISTAKRAAFAPSITR